MQNSLTTKIAGRFSKIFDVTSEKGIFHYVNLYFLGGRIRIPAPKFQIDPSTDYIVELELSYMTYKDSKGYDKSVFRPVSVISVDPL